MAPFMPEQQTQQEEAAAAGYSQLPGPSPAGLPTAGPTGQQFYPATAPPPYPSLAGPCSTSCAAPPAYTPYPPQQYTTAPHAYPPAPGAAVTGYPAGPPGNHVQPMSVNTVPVQGSGCCTVGWVLFGIGWLFPICWVVGALLPFCSKNRHDRRAAIASGIMMAISIVTVVLAVAIPLGVLAGAAKEGSLATSQDGYSSSGTSYNFNDGMLNSHN